MNWFEITNAETVDSPALLIFKDRMEQNIQAAINRLEGDVSRFRPHIKTNKTPEVCKALMQAGVTQFKCATIAEAEMLAQVGANDILLAYQPVGPKINRWIALQQRYPNAVFACLTDNKLTATALANAHAAANLTAKVYIDVNNGMNRSGIDVNKVAALVNQLMQLPNLSIIGLHVYDGHIRKQSAAERKAASDAAFKPVDQLQQILQQQYHRVFPIIAGGSTTFDAHAQRKNVICSPGTFIFWDAGYQQLMPEEPFEWAAVLITRVISIINATTITTDLGHKSVAAENPLPRVKFLNAPNAEPIAQSEEHMVVKVPDSSQYQPGTLLYAITIHICPTVALYNTLQVVENHKVVGSWKVVARDRFIHI
ncbi:D-TA family PLP-dependent enzyme [Hydrotalea sp.]|uniref:D-TA family PLP-dependent enzyme n=1 Tax=Hydrotalea sp. TaxID=2881279 RepID=UPI003D0DEC75